MVDILRAQEFCFTIQRQAIFCRLFSKVHFLTSENKKTVVMRCTLPLQKYNYGSQKNTTIRIFPKSHSLCRARTQVLFFADILSAFLNKKPLGAIHKGHRHFRGGRGESLRTHENTRGGVIEHRDVTTFQDIMFLSFAIL